MSRLVRHDEEMTGAPTSARELVGRVDEQRFLWSALESAADGSPCAVLVHGEAGVGKTRLVRESVRQATDALGATVLWGTCVRFGASTLQFAPILNALRGLLPPGSSDASAGRILPMVDALIGELAGAGPTVLVIDDLQWADVSSLVVLAYLIAGFQRQRLAIIAMCRDEDQPEGHPLHGWLADMRRMPSFTELPLSRLDLEQTTALLAQLQGGPPDLELAALVRERSDGNPYLTELLATALQLGAHDLPRSLPHRLRDALTATWHRLDPTARDLSRTLAVGGRPVEKEVLSAVATAQGFDPGDIGRALAACGVVEEDDDGRLWFRHPLLADVLYDAVPLDTRVRAHAVFAEVLATRPSTAAADLAEHHERAGNLDEAFRWSLQAASAASAVHASAEEGQHLVRACTLWPQVTVDGRVLAQDRVELMFRAAHVSRLSSRYDEAQRLLEEARDLVDEVSEPLLCSRLLTEWCDVTWEASPPLVSAVPERHHAVRLTEPFQDSVERETALSGLAIAEMWDGDEGAARAHADEALSVAGRSGSDRALAQALNSWAAVNLWGPGDEERTPLAAIEEAMRLARSCGDVKELVLGAIWLLNLLQYRLEVEEAADAGRRAFAEALRLGDLHWCHFIAGMVAENLLLLGRFDEVGPVLREGLAVRCVGVPGSLTRSVAAQLAIRRGQLETARQHLHRAMEVIDPRFVGTGDMAIDTVAELWIAEGRPMAAVEWVRSRVPFGDRRIGVQTIVTLARALGDVTQAARDTDDRVVEHRALEELGRWVDMFRESAGELGDTDQGLERVNRLIAAAEVARCRNDPDEMDRWQQVVQVCSSAGIRWEEACALRRLAEAAVRRNAPHGLIAAAVRRLHDLAAEMGAVPLNEQAERLARVSRISLSDPAHIPARSTGRASGNELLTAREREVLGHLVAGRTNTEIAASLFISDKTVSVHVSNILPKTGTSSRAEAAAWAMRQA